MTAIVIKADYDEEAQCWVAQIDDIPLVTEAATFEILCQKLPSLIQDVLGENGDARVGQDVPFELIKRSHSLPRADVACWVIWLLKLRGFFGSTVATLCDRGRATTRCGKALSTARAFPSITKSSPD